MCFDAASLQSDRASPIPALRYTQTAVVPGVDQYQSLIDIQGQIEASYQVAAAQRLLAISVTGGLT
jgi:hypothetical protein